MISLSETNFTPIPEGVHTFKITGVEYKETYGKLLVHMITETGKKHTERYGLLDGNGKPNSGAMTAFSFFARTVMNDFGLEEIDEQELVGHYFRATVKHNVVESTRNPGKVMTFVQLEDKEPADGFEEATEEVEEKPMTVSEDAVDDILKDLIG